MVLYSGQHTEELVPGHCQSPQQVVEGNFRCNGHMKNGVYVLGSRSHALDRSKGKGEV